MALKNETGETIGLVGTSRGIIASKQRERSLQEENKILQKQVEKLTAQLVKAKEDLKKKTSRYRHSEKAVSKSKLLLDTPLKTIKNALFILDAKTTKITGCSPSAAKIFAYRRDEMLNKTVDFLHVDASAL